MALLLMAKHPLAIPVCVFLTDYQDSKANVVFVAVTHFTFEVFITLDLLRENDDTTDRVQNRLATHATKKSRTVSLLARDASRRRRVSPLSLSTMLGRWSMDNSFSAV